MTILKRTLREIKNDTKGRLKGRLKNIKGFLKRH
jgi:hypothetical protein